MGTIDVKHNTSLYKKLVRWGHLISLFLVVYEIVDEILIDQLVVLMF